MSDAPPSPPPPPGMQLTHDGYLRIKRRPYRDQYAHRAYVTRLLGRNLRTDEVIHHLCLNKTCWPPTDFHLVVMPKVLHDAVDAGPRAWKMWRRRETQIVSTGPENSVDNSDEGVHSDHPMSSDGSNQ